MVTICSNYFGSMTGWAPMTVAVRTVTGPASIKQVDVIEIAITAAREVNFPPATKIDKENGLVEFGNNEMPKLGITAQVRVKSPSKTETMGDLDDVRTYLKTAQHAATLIYAHFKKEFGSPERK